MITVEDRRQIANQLDISYPLSNDRYRSDFGIGRVITVRYFWIAKFFTFYDSPWEGLMVCVVRDKTRFYGLLVFSEEFSDSKNLQHNPWFMSHQPRILTDWEDSVARTFTNINLLVDENPGGIFGSDGANYTLMLSSYSLQTEIQVSLSIADRPSIQLLTSNISNTVRHLVDLYDDDYIRKVVLPDSDE